MDDSIKSMVNSTKGIKHQFVHDIMSWTYIKKYIRNPRVTKGICYANDKLSGLFK